MMKKVIFILFVFALFAGCSNKLSLLAPYKEMVSVYGLLDQSDTTHYIRVQRVFLGEGNSYTFAQNQDSIYFKAGELKVTLERWKDGSQISVDNPATSTKEIVLTESLITTASGIFNVNERIYKTNHPLYANDSTAVYKLIIHNNKTGKDFTAQTGLIGTFQLISGSGGPVNYLEKGYPVATFPMNIVPRGNGNNVTCIYNSPANAGVCSLDMRVFYTDNNGGTNAQKTQDISLGTYYPQASANPTLGGSTEDFTYQGNSLLSDLAAVIPLPPTPSTTRTLNYIQFVLSAGGKDIALYNQVNASTSLSQNKANYSNINGGVGVFSSRHQILLLRNISNAAIDTISRNTQTCKLRFLDHSGLLSPCH